MAGKRQADTAGRPAKRAKRHNGAQELPSRRRKIADGKRIASSASSRSGRATQDKTASHSDNDEDAEGDEPVSGDETGSGGDIRSADGPGSVGGNQEDAGVD